VKYPHDVDFSPCGNYLAVANSTLNAIMIYKRNGKSFQQIANISGQESELHWPRAIEYIPNSNKIAVANLFRNTIVFFNYNGEIYEQTPCQIIKVPATGAGADGLALSDDGRFLAVTLHDDCQVAIYNGNAGVFENTPIILHSKTFNCPHSICYYKDYLFVTDGGKKIIQIINRDYAIKKLEIQSDLAIIIEDYYENGIKGIAFSSSGKMGICESQPGNPHMRISIYQVE
jgi:WD40 repeat protein